MPMYVFRHVEGPGSCREPLELLLKVGENPDVCPDCGRKIERVPAGFSHRKNVLTSSNLKEHGFTRLTRRDKGVYEKD